MTGSPPYGALAMRVRSIDACEVVLDLGHAGDVLGAEHVLGEAAQAVGDLLEVVAPEHPVVQGAAAAAAAAAQAKLWGEQGGGAGGADGVVEAGVEEDAVVDDGRPARAAADATVAALLQSTPAAVTVTSVLPRRLNFHDPSRPGPVPRRVRHRRRPNACGGGGAPASLHATGRSRSAMCSSIKARGSSMQAGVHAHSMCRSTRRRVRARALAAASRTVGASGRGRVLDA